MVLSFVVDPMLTIPIERAWELTSESGFLNSFINVRIIMVYSYVFQSLKELYVENNHLEYLPTSLGSMPNLEILDCRHNWLKKLPNSICQAQGKESQ